MPHCGLPVFSNISLQIGTAWTRSLSQPECLRCSHCLPPPVLKPEAGAQHYSKPPPKASKIPLTLRLQLSGATTLGRSSPP